MLGAGVVTRGQALCSRLPTAHYCAQERDYQQPAPTGSAPPRGATRGTLGASVVTQGQVPPRRRWMDGSSLRLFAGLPLQAVRGTRSAARLIGLCRTDVESCLPALRLRRRQQVCRQLSLSAGWPSTCHVVSWSAVVAAVLSGVVRRVVFLAAVLCLRHRLRGPVCVTLEA